MVQFGRHLQFYLESEQGLTSSHYIVPYTEIRDTKILNVWEDTQYSVGTIRTRFISEWRNALDKASEDFRVSTTAAWTTIFRAISMIPQARGAQLETALRLYTPTVGITASQDMLVFLKGIHSAATLNVEALRKLVKKFDKKLPASSSSKYIQFSDISHKKSQNGHLNGFVDRYPHHHHHHHEDSTPLCEELLPELYSTVFAIGIATIENCINILCELLDEDYDDDHANSDFDIKTP